MATLSSAQGATAREICCTPEEGVSCNADVELCVECLATFKAAVCFIALEAIVILVKILILSCIYWPVCLTYKRQYNNIIQMYAEDSGVDLANRLIMNCFEGKR